jgi:hypothetical protein
MRSLTAGATLLPRDAVIGETRLPIGAAAGFLLATADLDDDVSCTDSKQKLNFTKAGLQLTNR